MERRALIINAFKTLYFSSKKVAKTLLKDNRDSVSLWNAYAQILASSKADKGESRRVYTTLFQSYSELPAYVYRMAAELEMETGRPNAALGGFILYFDVFDYV